jgi:hypothetical protein
MVVAVDETGDLDVPRKRTCRQLKRGMEGILEKNFDLHLVLLSCVNQLSRRINCSLLQKFNKVNKQAEGKGNNGTHGLAGQLKCSSVKPLVIDIDFVLACLSQRSELLFFQVISYPPNEFCYLHSGGGQKSNQLVIHHSLATALRNVGLQVRAAQ